MKERRKVRREEGKKNRETKLNGKRQEKERDIRIRNSLLILANGIVLESRCSWTMKLSCRVVDPGQ